MRETQGACSGRYTGTLSLGFHVSNSSTNALVSEAVQLRVVSAFLMLIPPRPLRFCGSTIAVHPRETGGPCRVVRP